MSQEAKSGEPISRFAYKDIDLLQDNDPSKYESLLLFDQNGKIADVSIELLLHLTELAAQKGRPFDYQLPIKASLPVALFVTRQGTIFTNSSFVIGAQRNHDGRAQFVTGSRIKIERLQRQNPEGGARNFARITFIDGHWSNILDPRFSSL